MRVEPYTVGSYLHVIKRGARGSNIVHDESDSWRFLRMLFLLNDKHFDPRWRDHTVAGIFSRPTHWLEREPIVDIVAYTLMPNHFHLILRETQEGGVSLFMKRLGQSMTNHANEKYGESGSLWQGSFRSKTIDTDEYLRYVNMYVMVKNTFELYPEGGLEAARNNLEAGSEVNLTNSVIRYTGSWNRGYTDTLQNKGGNLNIQNSSLTDNNGFGLRHQSGTSTINNSVIANNGDYGVHNSTDITLDATNNYWGDSSGPYNPDLNPEGQGDRVSDNVLFEPWHGKWPPVQTLGEKAAELARQLVNQPDGYLWGGKGWDYDLAEFTSPERILSGYTYYNPDRRQKDTGVGLDCSGLLTWAFNRSHDASTGFVGNFVQYVNADGLYRDAQSDAITEEDLAPGDGLFFDWQNDGRIDHVAMYVGESGGYDVVNAASPRIGIEEQIKDEYKNITGFTNYRRIHQANVAARFVTGSPVDISVTDPDDVVLSSDSVIDSDEEYIREIPGELYYLEVEKGHDGKPMDVVYSPLLKDGNYHINVSPDESADPGDTYSLTATIGSTTIEIAKDEPIQNIPIQGFAILVSGGGTVVKEVEVPLTSTILFSQLHNQIAEAQVYYETFRNLLASQAELAEDRYNDGYPQHAVSVLNGLRWQMKFLSGRVIAEEDAEKITITVEALVESISSEL